MHGPNPYAAGRLDRAAHHRRDDDWLIRRLADARSHIVPVWRARNLVRTVERPNAVYVSAAEIETLVAETRFVAFLGEVDGTAHFAIDISEIEAPLDALPADGVFEDLRNVGPLLDRHEGSILAYARGLFSWHRRHLYCGVCGHPTESTQGGHVRVCTDAGCATQHFPRLDPAVIMLVHDGDRCILGRQPGWPAGLHSTLAGFVEPGESLEDAVAREIMEEVGIDVTDIRYHSSQPWPFPSSLMLGFHARARDDAITVYEDELEDARWFTREAIGASPEDESFRLPRPDSIARRLIEDWLNDTT
ncbi:MAG: NAD(+) diphosphatase [Alphaproteobacteria bacterium]|nr:NAD(+) diphosphatase [Alphaproteobacteria bacterium]